MVVITVANKTQYHRFQQEGEPGANHDKQRGIDLTNKGAVPQDLDMEAEQVS